MKKYTRLSIAVLFMLVVAVAAVRTWAAPGRQGTVPLLPLVTTVTLQETANFGTGTVSVDALTTPGSILTITKVENPASVTGAPPDGLKFLIDQILDISVSNGPFMSAQICVPQAPNLVNKTAAFHLWDAVKKVWVAVPTEEKSGTPPLICGTINSPGQYALIGK